MNSGQYAFSQLIALLSTTSLNQNNPNPFSADTKINYYIPNEAVNAYIYFYDLQGIQKKSIKIEQRGDGVIIVKGSEFQAGMYLYSLIVDNKLIDTKRMILTE